MTLQSMTGFARRVGQVGRHHWVWELKSVNSKGLEVRWKLPQGFERLEGEIRKSVAPFFTRGSFHATLTVKSSEARIQAVVNHTALNAVLALRDKLTDLIDPAPIKLDSLLMVRGIIDIRDEEEDSTLIGELDRDILEGLEKASKALRGMRESEGRALEEVLLGHVETIEKLIDVVENDPSRQHDNIRTKLENQLAAIVDPTVRIDRDRLYAEVALLATRADIREETDRLRAHITAVRNLIAEGGPVGRKLDFLSQEFNRESNTICSKSTSAAVTMAGIELKVVIDQFREQVQNLE